MRQIKYRVWDKKLGEMDWPEQIYNSMPSDGTYRVYMQFTGLRDAKGVEIYEGDILLYRKNESGVGVVKHYWEVFFSPKGQWRIRRGDVVAALYGHTENHEVIGNVYENGDLVT